MEKKQMYEFTFDVENITEKQADELLNLIIQWVEKQNTFMGGGWYPCKEDSDGKEK